MFFVVDPSVYRCRFRNRNTTFRGAFVQTGFTLLELMVGLTIGLIVAVAAAGSVVYFQAISRNAAEATRMQQDATLAFNLMGRFIRGSGSIALTPASGDTVTFTPRTTFSGIGADGLAVQGDSATAFRTSQTGGPNGIEVDCLGVPQTLAGNLITVFEWDNRVLRCGTAGAPMRPILERVEQMVVHYAERNPATNRTQYREFSTGIVWSQVVAMRVCLVLTSAVPMPDFAQLFVDAPGLRYDDCRGNNIAATIRTDRLLRRNYTHVFAIRNGSLS